MTNNLGLTALKNVLGGNNKENNNSDNGNRVQNKYLKDGESLIVRIPNIETCVFFYEAHSDFEEKIRPHACHKINNKEDLYDKAAKVLIKEAAPHWKKGDKEKYKEIRQYSNRFESQMRYKFGFYDLENGEPIIIDVSKKFGDTIVKQLEKHTNKINKFAFEISREGAETNTNYTLMPYIDDLTDEQNNYFETCGEKDFDTSLYNKTLYFKNETQQLNDLEKMGFDVSRIGHTPTGNVTPDETAQESTAEKQQPAENSSDDSIETIDQEFFDSMDDAEELENVDFDNLETA